MIDVVLLPSQLEGRDLTGAQVVILDILRASSTIVTALASGAREVRLFETPEALRAADPNVTGPRRLGGERQCLRIDGFDLGNSPAEYTTENVGGATVLLSTTNGTHGAVAAKNAGAATMFIGSLLNASATATALVDRINTLDTILLCAGTAGQLACEDVIGAGAILFQVLQQTYRPDLPFTDAAWLAYHAFTAVRPRLPAALRLGQGGINVIEAGLEDDINLCARLDAHPIVARVHADPLRVVKERQDR